MSKWRIFLITIVALVSCGKEGNTGLATISGTVKTELYDKNTNVFITSYLSPDERVYIIYGDNEIYNDDSRTHFDGKYEFDYLTPGTYTIYAYSECVFNTNTCPSGVEVVQQEIIIEKRKDSVIADTLIIKKYD